MFCLVLMWIKTVYKYIQQTTKVAASMHRVKQKFLTTISSPNRVAQSVTCLTADPGVVSLILARSHTFVDIDHEIISMVIFLTSAYCQLQVPLNQACPRKNGVR